MKQSERTCCICRSRDRKEELVRLVVAGEELIRDSSQQLPGRGAYVHPRVNCISQMNQASRWERALRLPQGTLGKTQLGSLASKMLSDLQSGGADRE